MTDFSNMPAGPEIDALVAEQVMRWHHVRRPNLPPRWERGTIFADQNTNTPPNFQLIRHADLQETGYQTTPTPNYPDTNEIRPVWAPSTNINHAFEIIRKWCDGGNGKNRVVIEVQYLGLTYCWFNREIEVEEGFAETETTPLAICRAALQATQENHK